MKKNLKKNSADIKKQDRIKKKKLLPLFLFSSCFFFWHQICSLSNKMFILFQIA